MKSITLLLLFIVCAAGTGWAQKAGEADFDAIEKTLKAGDATALAAHFTSTIECSLPGEENIYSKAQATMMMKSFFAKQVPENFSFKHRSNKQTIKYAIGTLQTQTGETFRITLFLKTENSKAKIYQLRIEKSNDFKISGFKIR